MEYILKLLNQAAHDLKFMLAHIAETGSNSLFDKLKPDSTVAHKQ